ncbi:MAG TPA: hypothetical protein VEG08_15750, partial [Terriglobales bacterium]|nr:hypothetical protein [Terriglobales bacterium]
TQAALLLLLASLAAPASPAQVRHDPLTEAETDQLREVSQDPAAKLKLYILFAHARMEAVEKARADAGLSPRERGRKVHAALEDLESLVDEISGNLESFAKREQDMRKPLREVISMDGDFTARLGALKQQASAPAQAAAYQEFQFILDDTLDSVKSNDELAHDLLQEQNQAAERKKQKSK